MLLSHVQLFATPWTVAYQVPLSMGFSRQEYWSGLPCPPPGDLSNPGIEPTSPALAGSSLPLSHQGSPVGLYSCCLNVLPSSFLFNLPGEILKKRERDFFHWVLQFRRWHSIAIYCREPVFLCRGKWKETLLQLVQCTSFVSGGNGYLFSK